MNLISLDYMCDVQISPQAEVVKGTEYALTCEPYKAGNLMVKLANILNIAATQYLWHRLNISCMGAHFSVGDSFVNASANACTWRAHLTSTYQAKCTCSFYTFSAYSAFSMLLCADVCMSRTVIITFHCRQDWSPTTVSGHFVSVLWAHSVLEQLHQPRNDCVDQAAAWRSRW